MYITEIFIYINERPPLLLDVAASPKRGGELGQLESSRLPVPDAESVVSIGPKVIGPC